jgi:ABC-type uncharacterized transport system substrate-binding protein
LSEKPADLPVQLSVKYETVLNMTTAKALGFDVPTSILLSADEFDRIGMAEKTVAHRD